MEKLKEILASIDLNNLLKIFDIQIAIGILVFFVILRSVFSKVVIGIYYKLTKSKKNPKNSSMYKPLNIFFILLGIFFAINILPTSKKLLSILNDIFKIIVIFYITKAILL